MVLKAKKKLRENKTFYYFANLIRYCRKKEFRDFVRGFGGPDTVLIQHPGVNCSEQLVYFISNAGGSYGFFAEIRDILKYLYYADKFHLVPVIYWGKSGFYQEDKPVNGTKNVFEYYFQPVSVIEYEKIKECKNVAFSFPRQALAISDGEWSDSHREMRLIISRFAEMYRKYCKLNARTQTYIESNLKDKLQGRKTLGIHVRGTDFKREFDAHPVAICAEDFIEPAKKIVAKYKYEQVFLATDTAEAVELFRKEFGNLLVVYEDIQRSDGDIGLHYLESSRDNHHYMLGLEVLRDAYTLAACDSLLAGMSNVSLAAQYIKIAEGEKHEEVVILDHGINCNHKIADHYYKTTMKKKSKK